MKKILLFTIIAFAVLGCGNDEPDNDMIKQALESAIENSRDSVFSDKERVYLINANITLDSLKNTDPYRNFESGIKEYSNIITNYLNRIKNDEDCHEWITICGESRGDCNTVKLTCEEMMELHTDGLNRFKGITDEVNNKYTRKNHVVILKDYHQLPPGYPAVTYDLYICINSNLEPIFEWIIVR